ncbi:MAG TPA: alpha-amylase family glycosyl hydrolase [Pyrinomonadaceae bacterium]|nr:alpha-amylase family glycosyl hydrolase [Pyrinomonadaceae bacterium]
MNLWRKYPTVYEINTWVWLGELSRARGSRVTLGDVPQEELERLKALGFDAVWMMGVWERSAAARRISRNAPSLLEEYARTLPDFTEEDIVGSPYAIVAYRVDPSLGGDEGLADFRSRLGAAKLSLILDFVPNHMAIDHPWIVEHPERLVQSDSGKLAREPQNYFRAGEGEGTHVFAHGRDPYFDGWPDTVQLDYRLADTRDAMTRELLCVASKCDGVRCDMAMLVTREIFKRTWGGEFDSARAEFWPEAIGKVREARPDFVFMAEVYWDMEYEMQRQGFDFAYDKRLYDRMLHEGATSVRAHLNADLSYQSRLARFIENHDEPRAMQAFGPVRAPAASTLAFTLAGLRLLHEGQLEGRRVKLSVHLGRGPREAPDVATEEHYRRLLAALSRDVFHGGDWRQVEPQEAWAGNPSRQNFVASLWTFEDEIRLAAVNLSPDGAQCYLPLGLPALAGRAWVLSDLLSDARYERDGDSLNSPGLYLDVPAFGRHLFEIKPL